MKILCTRYGVTRAGYYASVAGSRVPVHRDDKLMERVRAIFDASDSTYGALAGGAISPSCWIGIRGGSLAGALGESAI